jgi:molybdopterin/thiamine biosynthesis adenylyltransferase
MSADFEQQHSRTLLLPELELSHLEALAQAEAWVIGLGGLGAAVSLYLASAGVGRLHLVDGDRVELSNLPRQTLYGAADVGRPKAAVAAERLLALNPGLQVSPHCVCATETWLESRLPGASLVIDCTDRFTTRHAINRICWALGRPLVTASVVRWEGQLLVCDPSLAQLGCYACSFPAGAASEAAGVDAACGAFGVFPTMAGLMAMLQAQEGLKLLLGLSPERDLLLLQGPRLSLMRIGRVRQPACPACGGSGHK